MGMLRQTAKQGRLEGQVGASPETPSVSSTGFPHPTDPSTEATRDIGDGSRAPRDSEVSMLGYPTSLFCPPPGQVTALTSLVPLCAPQGLDGAGDLGTETCPVHALFLILHSGNILDSGPGDTNSKQADVQTLSLAFEAVTRVHFPEALGHVALRLVPCPPICAAAYALVSKYWSGRKGGGSHGVPEVWTATWRLLGPERPHGGRGRRPGSQLPGPVAHSAGPQLLVNGSITKAPWCGTCQQAKGISTGQWRAWKLPTHPLCPLLLQLEPLQP